jgi:predicted phage-related endonuclease
MMTGIEAPSVTHPLAHYIKPDAWHENRRKGLGGSDATILVEGDCEKIKELWLTKTGRKQPEPLLVLPVLMGIETEDLNVAWIQHVTGRKVWGCGDERVHPSYPWLRASLDGITTASDGREALVECKSVGAFWKPENLVKKYNAQLQHVMMVGGWEVSVFSAIIGNSKHFLTEVEFDPWYALDLLELEKRFWDCVVNDREPTHSIMRK